MFLQRKIGKINFTKQQARLIRVWSLKLNITFDTLVFELRPNFDYPIDQLIKTSHVKPGAMCCAGHQKMLSKPRSIKRLLHLESPFQVCAVEVPFTKAAGMSHFSRAGVTYDCECHCLMLGCWRLTFWKLQTCRRYSICYVEQGCACKISNSIMQTQEV